MNGVSEAVWIFSQTGKEIHVRGYDGRPICRSYVGNWTPVADAANPSYFDDFPRCPKCAAKALEARDA